MLQKTTSPLDPGSCFKQGYTVCNTIRIKPYSKKELCDIYQVSHRVLAGWLKPFLQEIGAIRGRYFTVIQVEIIFNKLGLPYDIREEA